jgi:hypothetical protein
MGEYMLNKRKIRCPKGQLEGFKVKREASVQGLDMQRCGQKILSGRRPCGRRDGSRLELDLEEEVLNKGTVGEA